MRIKASVGESMVCPWLEGGAGQLLLYVLFVLARRRRLQLSGIRSIEGECQRANKPFVQRW